jgi:molybdopterin biosynthesis enzyme MoaB
MKMAVLSFVSDPPEDPLGELVQQRLTRGGEDQIVREVLRPDLGRLKGLLLAALTDPRFDGILVVADLPGMGNESLISLVEASLQQPLPAWQPLVAQLLWPHIGSQALWSHGCLGRSHRRLLGALTGDARAVETILDGLLIPQLDRLLDWATR